MDQRCADFLYSSGETLMQTESSREHEHIGQTETGPLWIGQKWDSLSLPGTHPRKPLPPPPGASQEAVWNHCSDPSLWRGLVCSEPARAPGSSSGRTLKLLWKSQDYQAGLRDLGVCRGAAGKRERRLSTAFMTSDRNTRVKEKAEDSDAQRWEISPRDFFFEKFSETTCLHSEK